MAGGRKPSRDAKKLANVTAESNHEEATPRFCLRHLVDGFNVDALDKDGRAALAVAMAKRAQLTWRQIKQADRHGLGTEFIPAHQIKAPIPTHFSDSDRFMVFRYRGKLPMVGVRTGDTFHILWVEANFDDLYPHGS